MKVSFLSFFRVGDFLNSLVSLLAAFVLGALSSSPITLDAERVSDETTSSNIQ